MRPARALFATFGVSTALVAAGALSLLGLSAVVAIGGWPGLPDGGAQRTLVLADEALAPVPGETPAGVGLASGSIVLAAEEPEPRPREADAPSEPTTVRAGGQVQVQAPAPAPAFAPRLEAPSAPAASSDRPAEATPAPKSEPRTGDALREVTGGLGNTVQDTGDALGDVTGELSPELGQTVKDLTGLLGGTLRNTGALLEGTVELLLPLGRER